MIALKHLVSYSNQLAMTLKSGIPITKALASLEQVSPTRRLARISRWIREDIDNGSTLTQAFRKYDRDFPEMFLSYIAIAEKTGHLEEVTEELARFYEARYRMLMIMKSELLMITVYFAVCLVLIIFIDYVIAGWDERIVYKYLEYIGLIVVFLILLPAVLYQKSRKFRSVLQPIFHSLPFLGSTLKKFCMSRFASGMALGLKAGMEIRETIRFSAKAMASPGMERKVVRAVDYIEEGNTISEALQRTGVFPTLMNHMYTTGEESGELYEMMQRVAKISQEQSENSLKAITNLSARALYLTALVYIAYKIICFWRQLYEQIFSRDLF